MSSSTAVVVLGNDTFFKPSFPGVCSATVTKREDLSTCLNTEAGPSSLSFLHIVMKAMTLSALFDPGALSSFLPLLRPNAEVIVHIMDYPGEEDVDTVRMALVLANLRIESEEEVMGATIITARFVR
mmetsp:Transcript_18986/g.23921  ORF Transcript_18986/g.23921 Transcript_18986/m.23921 type:complete len:127 (+) Transcript_18986:88-468(+)